MGMKHNMYLQKTGMRLCALLFFYLMVMPSLFAQTDVRQYLLLDTILSFPNEEIINHVKPAVAQWGDELVFTNFSKYKSSDTIVVYRINVRTKQMDTLCFFIPDIRNFLRDNYSMGANYIAYNQRYLVLGFFKKVMLYQQDTNGKFAFQKEISFMDHTTDTSFRNAWFLDSNTLLLSNVQNSETPPTVLCQYNVEQGRRIKEIHPYFNTLLLANFYPQHLIDAQDNCIVFANRNEYSFLLYDRAFNRVDSLAANMKGWKSMSAKTINRINRKYDKTDAMDIINEVSKYEYAIDQLQWVYIVNPTKLMCVYTPVGDKQNQMPAMPIINIWEKKDGNWSITKQAIQDDLWLLPEDGRLSIRSYSIGFYGGNQVFVMGDNIVVLSHLGTSINPVGMTPSDYGQANQDYFAEKNPIVQLRIFTHTF
jgi:hypothetical protein